MTLTAEELDTLHGLAVPIAYEQHEAFITAVIDALMAQNVRGPGGIYRLAKVIQPGFIRTSTNVREADRYAADALTQGARHRATPAGIRGNTGVRRW